MSDEHPVQPLAAYIKIGTNGEPSLEGFRCAKCGEVLLETRRACPKCAAPDSLRPTPLSDRGTVFSYTIVHRSFPGIQTPFISAIVELEGGGFIKGNLLGVKCEANDAIFRTRVRIEFDRVPARADRPELLRHVFVPIEEQ